MRIPILHLGIVPVTDNDSFRGHLRVLCGALGYYLGTTVRGRTVESYPKLTTLLEQSQVDAAWVPPVVAMDLDASHTARPRVAMVRQNETSYSSALFVRRDSPLKSLADLENLVGAWVSPASASGYLVALAMLRARGISSSKAFKSHLFTGSHLEVVRAVAGGRADVGASFAHFEPGTAHKIRSSGWSESGVPESFRVLAAAGPIPTDVIAMHRSVSDEHASALTASLKWVLGRPERESAVEIFKCDNFEPCDASHLRGLRKLVRLLDRSSSP